MDKIPDNKDHAKYFEGLRLKRGMARPFNILFKLDKDLADSQFHSCPICKEDLYNGNKLHIHHIIPKSKGGKHTFENMVIIHESCHYEAHKPEKELIYKNLFIYYKKNHPRITNKKKT